MIGTTKQSRKRRAHMLIQLGALLVSQPDIFEALCRRTPEAVGAFERANPDIWVYLYPNMFSAMSSDSQDDSGGGGVAAHLRNVIFRANDIPPAIKINLLKLLNGDELS